MRESVRVWSVTGHTQHNCDELEKAVSTGEGDSGTSGRMLATLLTWMQEKTSAVFIICTANDITKLPPELLRAGRFDVMMFVDLPTRAERIEVFKVHLRRVGRDPEEFNLEDLADATNEFSGAEIRNLLENAMFETFSKGEEISTSAILANVDSVSVLAQAQKTKIEKLRTWAAKHALDAGAPESRAKLKRVRKFPVKALPSIRRPTPPKPRST